MVKTMVNINRDTLHAVSLNHIGVEIQLIKSDMIFNERSL